VPGTKHNAKIVIQTRDRQLLSELAVLRIMDRAMAAKIAGFNSTRRGNARLLQLLRAGLLRRFFVGSIAHGRKGIYTLSKKGAQLVCAELGGLDRTTDRLVVGDLFVQHQMAINQFYLALKYSQPRNAQDPSLRWTSFREAVSETIKLTPDGYFEVSTGEVVRSMFVEVDLGTESLKVWKEKIRYYLQLAVSGEFERRFHRPQFRVLVVGNSERRILNIRETVAQSTSKIFWFTTIQEINREGLWAPIWLRPSGAQRHSLQ
jgi:hypothetical protein